jgi:hydroxymethylpyrimidine/phosphomethylpyrimidine kinase
MVVHRLSAPLSLEEKRLFCRFAKGSSVINRILTIAGSDSGGGAGIQSDLKTISVLGAYGMSAVTALTAQNTVGVQGVYPVPADFVALQIGSVLSDIGADAVKTGMLLTSEIVVAAARELKHYGIKRLVVDPVMRSESGCDLLSESARQAMTEILFPLAHVVTPNLLEAEALFGFPVEDMISMKEAALTIHRMGPRWVLVKGGHLKGDAVDVLFDGKGFEIFSAPRLSNTNTHGTGCTFSAALATLLGQGLPMPQAVEKAKAFICQAIALGIRLGSGRGPTNPYAHILQGQRGQSAREICSVTRKCCKVNS